MQRILQLRPRILAMSASCFLLFGRIFPGGLTYCIYTYIHTYIYRYKLQTKMSGNSLNFCLLFF